MNVPRAIHTALCNRYPVERELGRGGMSTVYLSRDLKHQRNVAVKVLRPEIAFALGTDRFLQEIQTTANLHHPHILPLYDSGGEGSSTYYVMPYVEGGSLRTRLQRERQLPIDDAIRIACEVASALDYAHRRGVIHRDIKPENILLHEGQALVADFGIALEINTPQESRLTLAGVGLGTPYYMSPEQATAESSLDSRTDVYALGCVLYEMLVGEVPFEGRTTAAIVAQLMTHSPRLPTELRTAVPSEVEDAILVALRRRPADRWPSASAFAHALCRRAILASRKHRISPPFRDRSAAPRCGAGVLRERLHR